MKPIYIWQIGTKNRPATEEDIEGFVKTLNEIGQNSPENTTISNLIIHDGIKLLGIIDENGSFSKI